MQPFTTLTAVAAPLDLPNVDTDRIIPARFLRKPRGARGYATFLFHDVRFNADGTEKPDFVLNRTPYREAKILVTAENFGCGSSREMAPHRPGRDRADARLRERHRRVRGAPRRRDPLAHRVVLPRSAFSRDVEGRRAHRS